MLESIAQIIFLGSALGLALMIFRKIPRLAVLPASFQAGNSQNGLAQLYHSFWPKAADFSRVFLQKLLSKLRILALKVEARLEQQLRSVRQQELDNKKSAPARDYWEKLRKSKQE